MTFRIAFFLCCTATFLAKAQPYISRDGRFQVDQVKGCAPLTVNVAIIPPNVCSPAVPCEFFYETNPIQNIFSHQYTVPGTYTLRVLFQAGVPIDQITITVLPNTPPEFEIYSCGGNGVQVNITDTNYDRYVIDFNDATLPVETNALTTVTHTYASSGNKTVTVRGRNLSADDNCNPASKVVNAVPTLPVPTITQLTVLNAQDIQLDFNTQPNILYRLQVAQNSTTSFQSLLNVYETSTTTINNLQTDANFYCFRLGVFDPCNNTTVYSNTICSSNFDVSVLNNTNRLSWATSSMGVSNYLISKNMDPPLNAAPTATSLDDTNVSCGVNYCYQQTTNYSNGSRSISLSKCATAQSTDVPAVVENISSAIGNEGTVDLEWTQDPAYVASIYNITKTVNGTFANVNSSPTTTYTDDEYLHDVVTCYTISYTDACNNKSPASVQACPIRLIPTRQPDNTVSLSWTPYEGWENGVDHYVVQKFNGQGQLLGTVNVSNATTYVDNVPDSQNQTVVYRITAIANDAGIASSVSNAFTVIKEPNLFHPTAFTPNDDGLNDIFNVYGQFITAFEMRIFNRWGEMMYVTEDLEDGWDGHYKGTLMPEGTYVFRATITDQVGRTYDRSGTVVLLKKQ
jgi:gliding motility-associated-like protein